MNKVLIGIIVLAAILRLWGLNYNPPHLTSDEASLGYNAYSILKTGRDEHGVFMPIIFESFGDWKPGLYVYLSVPFVAALGLNEWAVRLPSAIAGIMAVLLVYKIVLELFANKRLALASAFFLAISPWHLQFSRGAWEANLSLTLVLFGIYFFLRSMGERRWYIFLSVLSFGLTFWTYQGAKLSTTIVIVGLLFFHFRELLRFNKKIILLSLVIGGLIILPVALSLFQGKTGRLEVYSIFSYQRPENVLNDILDQNNEKVGDLTYDLYHTETLNFVRGIFSRWTNHYSPRFLFFDGDWSNFRHSVPHNGEILFLDIIFLITGLIFVSKGLNKSALFIWFWLLLAPLPAALSRDSIHAVRALSMAVPLSVILGMGLVFILEKLKNIRILLFSVVILYLANYFYYLDAYWVHAPYENSQYWQYGYKQMVQKVTTVQGKYPEIIVKQDYSQPYIFFLFYQKYDPIKYQKISQEVFIPNKLDVGLVSRLDNISFRDINWSADKNMHGKLFIVDPIKVPFEGSSDEKETKLVDQIKYLNGQTAFNFLEIK